MPTVTYDYAVGNTAPIKLPVVVDYRRDEQDANMITGKVTVSQLGMYGPWDYSFEAVLANHRSEDGIDGGRIIALTVKADAYNHVVLAYDYKWIVKGYGHRDRAVLEALISAFS